MSVGGKRAAERTQRSDGRLPARIHGPLTAPDEVPGLEDVWQVHRSLFPDPQNTTAERIANLSNADASDGHWLKASVRRDGTFTLTNGRTGFIKNYRVHTFRDADQRCGASARGIPPASGQCSSASVSRIPPTMGRMGCAPQR
jgi:hypothetical protein